mmetsp:Transcript_58425/g.174052  ORF Transcript_58425/g.174052 Transcript_58425/m.174052 type:complete len:251 (+) Transcript_58425:327-1079(+)
MACDFFALFDCREHFSVNLVLHIAAAAVFLVPSKAGILRFLTSHAGRRVHARESSADALQNVGRHSGGSLANDLIRLHPLHESQEEGGLAMFLLRRDESIRGGVLAVAVAVVVVVFFGGRRISPLDRQTAFLVPAHAQPMGRPTHELGVFVGVSVRYFEHVRRSVLQVDPIVRTGVPAEQLPPFEETAGAVFGHDGGQLFQRMGGLGYLELRSHCVWEWTAATPPLSLYVERCTSVGSNQIDGVPSHRVS